jgi:hypothetical protein
MRKWYKEHEHLFSMVMYIGWAGLFGRLALNGTSWFTVIVEVFFTLGALWLAYESLESHRHAVYIRKLEEKQRAKKS